jgi:L-idonate 5-dehydrogenase
MVLGHEVSGVVAEAGAAVEGLRAGDAIAISPSRPCGACRYCQQGQQNQCLDMRFYGSAMRMPHVQGAFRHELVIDRAQAHLLPAGFDLSLAAMAEPLSVGLHAIQRAGPVFGKQVLVTGCGPIGALLVGSLRRAGAAHIVAVDLAARPLACARDMGADVTLDLKEHPEALQRYTGHKGHFDVMFEASGSDHALRAGLDVVRPRGVIVAIGLGGESKLPLNALVGKELELRGTFRFHEEFAVAVQFIREGLVDVRPVISHVVDFEQAGSAFELAGDKARAMKVQLKF